MLVYTRYENSKLYDSFWYGFTAVGLAQGHFFQEPFSSVPTATHPPLTSLLLVPASYLFGYHTGTTPQRLTMAMLEALVVLFVGLLGSRMAGPWAGLTAAVLAALAPDFWMPSGILMSETPAMLCTALVFLAIVRLDRSPALDNAALVRVVCGAAALARPELALYVPFLAVPAALEVGFDRRGANESSTRIKP
ncbi:MAG: ArnT family glycosyltransferase [Acidimicrobiales bacterium]